MFNRKLSSTNFFAPLREIISIAITSLLLAVALPGCVNKVDKIKAQALVENLLNDMKNENYSSVDKYYTSSFNENEPQNHKVEKFKRLKETLGAMKSFELISAKEHVDSDKGINEMELKYKVTCERAAVEETYLVINDEGDEKIIFQNIENAK